MTSITRAAGLENPLQNVFPTPVISTRAPTAADKRHPLGQIWVDTTNSVIYGLSRVAAGQATWSLMSPGASDVDTLEADSGTSPVVPSAGAITMTGGTNISTVGGTNEITFNLDGAVTLATSLTSPLLIVPGGAATDYIGTATLVSGTVTIANTNITANDRIFIQRVGVNASLTAGVLTYTISAGVSFTINSLDTGDLPNVDTTDLSTVAYFIVRQS